MSGIENISNGDFSSIIDNNNGLSDSLQQSLDTKDKKATGEFIMSLNTETKDLLETVNTQIDRVKDLLARTHVPQDVQSIVDNLSGTRAKIRSTDILQKYTASQRDLASVLSFDLTKITNNAPLLDKFWKNEGKMFKDHLESNINHIAAKITDFTTKKKSVEDIINKLTAIQKEKSERENGQSFLEQFKRENKSNQLLDTKTIKRIIVDAQKKELLIDCDAQVTNRNVQGNIPLSDDLRATIPPSMGLDPSKKYEIRYALSADTKRFTLTFQEADVYTSYYKMKEDNFHEGKFTEITAYKDIPLRPGTTRIEYSIAKGLQRSDYLNMLIEKNVDEWKQMQIYKVTIGTDTKMTYTADTSEKKGKIITNVEFDNKSNTLNKVYFTTNNGAEKYVAIAERAGTKEFKIPMTSPEAVVQQINKLNNSDAGRAHAEYYQKMLNVSNHKLFFLKAGPDLIVKAIPNTPVVPTAEDSSEENTRKNAASVDQVS